MHNPTREMSVDELDTVSGGDNFTMGAALQVASAALEAGGNATVSSTPRVRQSGAAQIDRHGTAVMAKINALYVK